MSDAELSSGLRKRQPSGLRKIWDWASKWLLGCFALIFGVATLVVFFTPFDHDCLEWLCLRLESTECSVPLKHELIKYCGLACAGTLSAWGVLAASQRTQTIILSVKAQTDAVEATEAENRQQRFRDGVSHLGHDKESMRQGGADTLFHLALDNKELRASITGILCVHARAITGDKQYQTSHKNKPSTEIQSLLNLLFTTKTRSPEIMDAFWKGLTPDLSGGYFRGAKLPKARFRKAELDGAQFQGADLDGAQFQGAELKGAQFQGARLVNSKFQGAYLVNAQFQGAYLVNSKFQGAWLDRAQFHGAWLSSAQFQMAILGETQFQGADLEETQFQMAVIGGITIQDLRRDASEFLATWPGKTPHQIDSLVGGAEFQGAYLGGSEFQGTNLGKADFSGAFTELTVENEKFKDRIQRRTDEPSTLYGIRFAGGMSDERVEKMVEELEESPHITKDQIQRCKDTMKFHVKDNKMHQDHQKNVVENFEGKKYDSAAAARWIREYQEAVASVPKFDDTDK